METKHEKSIQNKNLTKNFWCHICRIEFSKIVIEGNDVMCRACSSNFIEDISETIKTGEEHPSTFEVYEKENTNNNSITISILSTETDNIEELVPRAIYSLISSFIERQEVEGIDNLINYLVINDMNNYGNPPAGKHIIENLPKLIIDKEYLEKNKNNEIEKNCSICKDEFELNQFTTKLPCSHLYHNECILPWLNERNSCPTCRYELETDDQEYEINKKEKIKQKSD